MNEAVLEIEKCSDIPSWNRFDIDRWHISMQVMTPASWSRVADNPRQRDTVRHAAKAKKRHLAKPSPVHSVVFAARLPNMKLVKLDGHTRSHLWESGELEAPKSLYVVVVNALDETEVRELYTYFDNLDAVEGAQDKAFGALSDSGVRPQSPLLKSCRGIRTALVVLSSDGKDTYSVVNAWAKEFKALDDMGLKSDALSAGGLAGALAVIRKRGFRGIEFIRMVANDEGTRNERGSDGVDAITRYMKEVGGKGRAGREQARDLAERFVSCCEAHLSGYRYKQQPKRTDLKQYLEKA